MGISDKIDQISEEMNRTQKNKATEYHLGLLKGVSSLCASRREEELTAVRLV